MPDAPQRYYTVQLSNEKPLPPPPPKSPTHILRVKGPVGRKFVTMIIHSYYTIVSGGFRNARRYLRKHNPIRSSDGLSATSYKQRAPYLPSEIRVFISGHTLMYQTIRGTETGIAFGYVLKYLIIFFSFHF